LFDFIGIPFQNRASSFIGADCYGLVRLVYKEKLNIDVPQPISSAYASRHVEREYLKEISTNWYKVDIPQKYDVVAMAHDPMHPKIVQHFGIVIDETHMLHTLDNVGSHIVKILDYKHFIKGYYRHVKVNNI
jgi:cell wall-associated NlpC family hydrolase